MNMNACSLILFPYGRNPSRLLLTEENAGHPPASAYLSAQGSGEEKNPENICIFSDLTYIFMFSSTENEWEDIREVHVYINDAEEECVYGGGRILFPGKNPGGRRIFQDCYGFAEIAFVITDGEGEIHTWSTGYLPVLVRQGNLNDSVKAMVHYVYDHQEELLLSGEPGGRGLADLKENGYQSFLSQMILAEEIASLYESSFGYFKANRRFRIEKIPRVDQLEHLQYVTPDTIRYLASHPEELRQSSHTGIRIRGRIYQPERVLSVQNEEVFDTYENRVILNFLWKMLHSVSEMRNHCEEILSGIPEDEKYNAEYIYSSYFLFAETRRMLEEGRRRLSSLRNRFASLLTMYNRIFGMQPEIMAGEPAPSPVLLNIPQYNRIFVQIHRWFRYGIYDFSRETFMLSFIRISSLYEVYLLAKMNEYFRGRGYEKLEEKRCLYPVKHSWKYRNTECSNTFLYKNGRWKVTLYYQPVIYDTDESAVNGIGLIRNNTIAASGGEEESDVSWNGGSYYTPDYILKAEDETSVRYLILDAKFSDQNGVRRHHVKNLAFKYLFSVSPIREKEHVIGMSLIYGKCNASDEMQSAYDRQLPGQRILPIAELIPMIEGISDEKHEARLDELMRIFLRAES